MLLTRGTAQGCWHIRVVVSQTTQQGDSAHEIVEQRTVVYHANANLSKGVQQLARLLHWELSNTRLPAELSCLYSTYTYV